MMPVMASAPTRKELSHDRIVEVASRAIRRGGYKGMGVADIMKEAGLTHGGFYAHFASRDALLVEAMQHAGRESAASLDAAIERRMARGRSRFEALVESYLHDAHLERPEQGCVVAALASEMTRQDDAVREEACARVQSLVERVAASLPEGQDPAQAAVITATLVGALQLARTLGGAAGRAVLTQAREALLRAHVSEETVAPVSSETAQAQAQAQPPATRRPRAPRSRPR
jgi:AcrR family transcriptional regulator